MSRYSKRPDAAKNALPKVKYVSHAAGSGLLTDPLDLRTAVGRAYRTDIEALTNHIGGSPTSPERCLIDQAVRLGLLSDIAWAELMRSGLFSEGSTSPAFEAFLKASRDERAILQLLGLERKAINAKEMERRKVLKSFTMEQLLSLKELMESKEDLDEIILEEKERTND